jgi:hypothetical protein
MSLAHWFCGYSTAMLDFLVKAGIVTIGIGYLCNALFTIWMLNRETCRLVDFSKLMLAFGLSVPRDRKLSCYQQRRLEEQLLAEFHLRLHSHAPQSLIDHCSRRTSGWYIAKTSALASIIGWIVAVAIIFTSQGCVFTASCREVIGGVMSFVAFVLVIPYALCWQGTKWNQEYWGVCWKWIYWDQQTHPLPQDWLKPLQNGVD